MAVIFVGHVQFFLQQVFINYCILMTTVAAMYTAKCRKNADCL